jgi:hypothetical protein
MLDLKKAFLNAKAGRQKTMLRVLFLYKIDNNIK